MPEGHGGKLAEVVCAPTPQFSTGEPCDRLKSESPRWRDIWSSIRSNPELEIGGLLSSQSRNKKRLNTVVVKTLGWDCPGEIASLKANRLPLLKKRTYTHTPTTRPHLLVAIDSRKQGDKEGAVRDLSSSKVFSICSLDLFFCPCGLKRSPFIGSQEDADHPFP